MNVFDAVRMILAVRQYQDIPVSPEVTRRIVEAGHLTGSSMNRQPWHFIVVENRETLEKIGALASTGHYIAQAPMAIVVVTEESRFAVSDASRAIQSMMLTAWDEGLGSNWVGFHGLEGLKPMLGIPEAMDVFAVLPFGYPAGQVGQGKKNRKPLGQVAHRERFDQPFE